MRKIALLAAIMFVTSPAVVSDDATLDKLCPIQIRVGDRKTIDVIVPCFDRNQLIDMMSEWWSRGHADSRMRFKTILRESGPLSLTLTTERIQAQP